MPLAASYLRNNDYNVLKFSPYQLNVNDIAKTLAVKTAYWNQGAERVKSRYMDAANLDVSNPQNQQVLKDYINKSEDMIKSLSSQDLGNPDIQQEGIGIFKNLFNDKGIMFDDALTKHYNKVRSDYQGLLKTDPSKASMINLAYAMEDQEKFINDPDRNSSEGYYKNRKDYHPFYDATSEINNVMKNCKGDVITSENPYYGNDKKNASITGYSNITSDKSLSSARVKQCFEKGLSEQARQQFNITGYMTFKNNKDALANEVLRMNNSDMKLINMGMSELVMEEAKLLNKQKTGKISPEELTSLNNMQATKKNLQSQIDNYTGMNQRLAKKDYSDLDKNLESIAGSVFTDIKTSGFGNAFSFTDFSNRMVAHPAQMLHIRQQFEESENAKDRLNKLDLKKMEIDAKKMADILQQGKEAASDHANMKRIIMPDGTEKFTVNDERAAPLTKEDVPQAGDPFGDFNNQVKNNTQTIHNNNIDLGNALLRDTVFMASAGFASDPETGAVYKDIAYKLSKGEDVDPEAYAGLMKYVEDSVAESPENHPDYDAWRKINEDAQTRKNILDERMKTIENAAPAELTNTKLAAEKIKVAPSTITVKGAPVSITKEEMMEAMEGKDTEHNVKIIRHYYGADNKDSGVVTFTVDGQEIMGQDYAHLDGMYGDLHIADRDRQDKLHKYRTEKYGNAGWAELSFYTLNPEDKARNVVGLDSKLANLIPGDEDTKMKAKVISTDYQGGVMVVLPGYKGGVNKIKDYIGGVMPTIAGQTADVIALTGDRYLIKGLSDFDYSKQLGLDPSIFQLGISLKAIGANLKDDTTKEVKVPIAVPDKRFTITAVKGRTTPPSYRLTVEDTKVHTKNIISTKMDPIELIQIIQTIQNSAK